LEGNLEQFNSVEIISRSKASALLKVHESLEKTQAFKKKNVGQITESVPSSRVKFFNLHSKFSIDS
jgi:hypothetical protein